MDGQMEMQRKVEKTTKMYEKTSGMIVCNKGEQERQVRVMLENQGYTVTDVSLKKSRAMLRYVK